MFDVTMTTRNKQDQVATWWHVAKPLTKTITKVLFCILTLCVHRSWSCDVTQRCPDTCGCSLMNSTEPYSITINCTGKQRQSLPETMPFCTESFTYKLHFQYNDIESIDDRTYLEFVTYLDLSHNRINFTSPAALNHLKYIKTLKLDHNSMETIPTEAVNLQFELKSLTLHNNPWRCDCNTQYLAGWMQNFRDKNQLNTDKVFCAEPNNGTLVNAFPNLYCNKAKPKEGIPVYGIILIVAVVIYLVVCSTIAFCITLRRRFKIQDVKYIMEDRETETELSG